MEENKALNQEINNLNDKLEKIHSNLSYYNSLLNSFRKQHYTKFNLKKFQNCLVKILR